MRVDGKGVIDRGQPVRFHFDGRVMAGFAGDTVASALLANGVHLVGRSFKYHRPRGILAAGSEEPNALITAGSGDAQTPNVRATVQEIHDGLQVWSQNRWPSLRHDILGANDAVARFLSAGFYYKTFMWPRTFWKRLYEPVIRRAAGLGALSGQDDRALNDKAWAFCDVLIIGAGPAGLIAALKAGRAGLDVILADENAILGGRLLDEDEVIDGKPAADWVRDVLAELRSRENVRIMCRTTVTGVFDQGVCSALERSGLHVADPAGVPLETFWRIVAKRMLLCAGALERPIAFANNDRPGIMLASAARSYLHRFGVVPGQRVVLFCNNDDAYRAARDLRAAGVEVEAVVDSRERAAAGSDFPVFRGAWVSNTRGRHRVSHVEITQGGEGHWVEADCLLVSGGWNPTLHLSCHLGGRPIWNEEIAAFVPAPGAVPGMQVAGAAAGVFSTKGALKSGSYRVKLILEELGHKMPTGATPQADDSAYVIEPLWAVPGKGRAWLDLQNDVTVKDVELAARENYASVEHMKRYTTQGMAPDQGKSSNVLALAVLADVTGRAIPETGTTTFRPPFGPVSIAAMGADGAGKGFAPERFLTSDAASRALGAPMVEAGLWYRPLYFPVSGEKTWRQSCDREVTMVREAAGVCDVSSLGKIDIQGRDAAQFVDFVYTNMMSSLRNMRVRYGLMLREDGFVMDDGTCARLGREHFLVTTTTAAAGQVMAHLDFVHQCLRPDWDVRIASVTEHWAQFAIAGPKAGEVLNGILDTPVSRADLPFMGCMEVQVGRVPGRLFRISFSGELGYELAIPARYGESLFKQLLQRAESLGGGPYGMEALNVLRIEKGFLTHAEINGRVTADDLGLARMLSAKKDFIGKVMAARPGLQGPQREQLVGLFPVGPVKQLSAGASLFNPGAEICRENAQGHVTSVAFSPSFGRFLGLALLQNGRARHGEKVRMMDHLRGLDVLCEVSDPVVYDPEGGRARG